MSIFMDNVPLRPLPIQISKEEIEIINDIRSIDFGRISLTIQNGTMISKEITTITKMIKNKQNNSSIGAGCDQSRKREGFLVLLLASILPIIEILSNG